MKNAIFLSALIGCLVAADNAAAGASEAEPPGSNHTLLVESKGGSAWVVESLVPWITINAPNSGAGTKAVSYTVSGNSSSKVRSGQIRILYAFEETVSWVISTVDSRGVVGTENSLKFRPDGKPCISYYDSTNRNLKFASFNGTKWSTETVDDSGSVGNHSSLGIASNGTPDISYQDLSSGNLKFAFFDGRDWHIHTVDAESNVGGYGTSLNYGPDGFPAISYYDRSRTGLKVQELGRSVDGSLSWYGTNIDFGQQRCNNTIPPSCSYVSRRGEYSSLGFRPDGTLTASYVDTTYSQLRFAEPRTEFAGGLAGFFQSKWLSWNVDSGAEVAEFTSLDYDFEGNHGIAYALKNGGLKFAFSDGSRDQGKPVWSFTTIDSGNVGAYASLSFNAQGNPGISYYDKSNASLKYAFSNGTTWTTETVDGDGLVGEYTALSYGPEGYPGISYYDRSSGDLKFARLTRSKPEFFHTVIQEPTNPGTPDIVFGELNSPCTGSPVEVQATSSQGMAVDLQYYGQGDNELILLDGPPVEPGSYRVVATGGGGTQIAIKALVIESPYFVEDQGRAHLHYCHPVTCNEWECASLGSVNSFSVLLGEGVSWTVKSLVPWITINGAGNGTGPGTVNATINANYGSSSRNGQIVFTYQDGQLTERHTFFQGSIDPRADTDGDGLKDIFETNTGTFVSETDTGTDPRADDSDQDGHCDSDEIRAFTDPSDANSFPVSTSLFQENGGPGDFTVGAPDGVSWTAESDVSWITITGTGTGTGTVSYLVEANAETSSRSGRIRVRSEQVDGAWEITTVDSDGSVGQYTSLSHGPDGNPAICYYDNTNDDLKFASFDGTGWNTETVDSEGNVGWWDTALSHSQDGTPAIAYYDRSNYDLKYAFFNGTDWEMTTVDSPGNVGRFNSISHGPGGQPAIAYYDWTNRDLKFASFNGQGWDIEIVDSEGMIGTEVSLKFDPEGNPAISYHDVGFRDVKFASFDGQRWNIETVDSVDNVGQYRTSLSYGPDGNPAISYYDATNQDLKFASFDGVGWKLTTVDQWKPGEVTESIGSADGSILYQKILGNNPVIAGPISVTDGTYTWSELGGSSDADNFAVFYSANLNRITVSYLSGDPNDGREITVTYRPQGPGLPGAESRAGSYSSLSHGPDGNPVISYYDIGNNDLKVALFDGVSWATQVVDQDDWVGQYSSLGHDPQGNLAISYFDNTNDDLKVARYIRPRGVDVIMTVIQDPNTVVDPEIKVQVHGGQLLLSSPQFEISFSSVAGINYSIQSSKDLKIWRTIEAGIPGSGGVIYRSILRDESALFFRIIADN
ncbi:MAG: BACON domain-containing carbohydrate-binding protein [Verrucomicrobiales bacterium]